MNFISNWVTRLFVAISRVVITNRPCGQMSEVLRLAAVSAAVALPPSCLVQPLSSRVDWIFEMGFHEARAVYNTWVVNVSARALEGLLLRSLRSYGISQL